MGPQPVAEPEIEQQARGIGRELNAGAGLLEPLGLLQNDDTETASRQRQCRSQTADAGAGNDDDA